MATQRPGSAAESGPIAYDDQAGVFETRAGLPQEAAAEVAAAVRDLGDDGRDRMLLEIGAGTGVIGRFLARPPGRYLGIDASRRMLDVFSPRLDPGGRGLLVRADADQPWPVRDGTASVIFGSRVLHLLQPEQAVAQARRVARLDGAVLLCGRVEHHPDSPRARARAKLRELLIASGLQPRPTGGRPDRLLALAAQAGAEALPVTVAATWPEALTTHRVIEWWRGKTSIGGINPPPHVAAEIIDALTRWARHTQPSAPVTTVTRYLLEGVRFPPPVPGHHRRGGTST